MARHFCATGLARNDASTVVRCADLAARTATGRYPCGSRGPHRGPRSGRRADSAYCSGRAHWLARRRSVAGSGPPDARVARVLIGSTRAVRVWAWPAPVDLRRGFNGLFGLVEQQLRKDPLSGELFLFTNKRRTGCKVLFWDGTGLCLFIKRLERGRFAALWRDGPSDGHTPVALTASELALFVEGSALVGKTALSPIPIVPNSVAVRSVP